MRLELSLMLKIWTDNLDVRGRAPRVLDQVKCQQNMIMVVLEVLTSQDCSAIMPKKHRLLRCERDRPAFHREALHKVARQALSNSEARESHDSCG